MRQAPAYLAEGVGFASCNGVNTPMSAREEGEKENLNEKRPEMDIAEARRFRRAGLDSSYLTQGRPGIVVAWCVLARAMARPRV